MKILLELFFVKNIYDLQRVTLMADEEMKYPDEYPNPPSISFDDVWYIPENVNCYLGHLPHSACAQVKIFYIHNISEF
jgi:hypothetical protein